MDQAIQQLPSSFRDPSGFVFSKDGMVYRQVNKVFREDFDHFISSGCYAHLTAKHWLIPHEEMPENFSKDQSAYKTLRPLQIPFISHPYEWCFDMLRDAATLTLQLAKESIAFGLILKDATPFNVQWLKGKPIFIDSLSFEKYDPSTPWIAYRQFCENFLAPLLLMHYSGQALQSLFLSYPEGIPLPVTRALLPWKSKFSFNTFLHVHLHDRLASKAVPGKTTGETSFSEKKLLRLLESLLSLVQSLHWKAKTTWANYYSEAAQRNNYLTQKQTIIETWLNELPPLKTAIDLGANEGRFAMLLGSRNINTLAVDADANAVNLLYQSVKRKQENNILPLIIDLANPSPAIGLNNAERSSFSERVDVDMAFALALVHHLVIGRNIPLGAIAKGFSALTSWLIVEFVPKDDDKVQLMLKQKKDIYDRYCEQEFLRAFEGHFSIRKREQVGDSGRTIYLMKNVAK